MLKKALTFLVALALMTGVTAGFAAEPANGEAGNPVKTERSRYPEVYEKALAAAKTEVPATALFQGIITDRETDTTVDLSFFDNSTLRAYDVTVVKDIYQVKTVRIGGSNLPGSVRVNKTVDDVAEMIRQEYPDGQITSIDQKQEGNLHYYEAQVKMQRFTADLKINPVTGAIASRVLEYNLEYPAQK